MAIYKLTANKEKLNQLEETSFTKEGIREVEDLQRILQDQPQILEEGLFVVGSEFSDWQGSNRSIDLLCLDENGRLVVIELKRNQTGDHAELQAIRYAAMVANLTYDRIVDAHRAYLNKRGFEGNAEELIQKHLDTTGSGEIYTKNPRIVLVSENFSRELTTGVLWLRDNDLDIRCIRLQPYRRGLEILVETNQIIPLTEAEEYLVKFRDGERERETIMQGPSPKNPIQGGDAFRERIQEAPENFRLTLERLYEWAIGLEKEKLANLSTSIGKFVSLRLQVPGKNALISIYNRHNGIQMVFWTTAFRKYAPESMLLIDELESTNISTTPHPTRNRHGNNIVSEELLAVLTDAYKEANGLGIDGDVPVG